MSRYPLTPLAAAMATIAATLLLSGCTEPMIQGQTGMATSQPAPEQNAGQTGGAVALLVPLSGKYAAIGQSIEQSVKLAFSAPGSPRLDVHDTGGTPSGAIAAAKAAIGNGDGLFLGPLTKEDTKAITPVTQSANINVLAFTNDSSVARPGVWPLGISPGQQVRRVVSYAINHGRTRTAALLPEGAYGQLMSAALNQEAQALGTPAPRIQYFSPSFSSLNQGVRSVSDFDSRGASIEAKIRAARDLDNQTGRTLAAKLQREPIPPPPYDALLIGATGGQLAEIQNFLPYYDSGPPQVQILGPALWAHDAAAMATHEALRGALYAAPDPSMGSGFIQKFQATYGNAPVSGIDKVGFDAGAIAVLASREGGYTINVLTNPSGFTGADGVLRLNPDGHVQRGLAVFKVESGGPQIVSPAPQDLPPPTAPAAPPTS